MKTLICTEPGKLSYADAAEPAAKEGEVIVRIKRIGICGTDLHAFEGTQPYFNYPRILGHELAAIRTDNNKPVALIPYLNCGECIACRSGKPNCCVNISVYGVHVDGGMAEYMRVPGRLLIEGEGLSLDELALLEPLAIGAHGIRRAAVQPGEFVLVIGAGPIGLGLMEFAGIAGGRVIAVDVNDARLSFCREKLNIQHTINPVKEDIRAALATLTGGDMPTVVIDATGNQGAINGAFNYMAHGGRYVLVGLQKGDLVVSHPEFHKREATLMSNRNATRADFEQVIDSLKSGRINPKNYITHRAHFDEAGDIFMSWLDPKNGVIKAMIELDE